jgi:predicted RNase H-related nuclease YkuK (DUF458 family)
MITKSFRNIDNKPVDVLKHTLEILNTYPNVKIHIGTDSQSKRAWTRYSTVIAYRYGSSGVHYIYTLNRIPRVRDLWSRLWKEIEYSMEIAQWLTEKISINIEIDMDYSPDEINESNKLISAASGWATSMGYKVNVKPDNQIATKAADHMCR